MTQLQQTVREFRTVTRRVSVSTTVALWVCLILTITVFITSFIVPPTGVIDPSAFKAAGYMFGFAALFEVREAIREGLGVKLTHGDTIIEVEGDPGISEKHSKK